MSEVWAYLEEDFPAAFYFIRLQWCGKNHHGPDDSAEEDRFCGTGCGCFLEDDPFKVEEIIKEEHAPTPVVEPMPVVEPQPEPELEPGLEDDDDPFMVVSPIF